MTADAEDIAGEIVARAGDAKRVLVAIAGPPGAGKSTIADQLAEALRAMGETAVVLPMDGFHMDDGILRERQLLPRKGAPETFDVRGLIDIVRAIRAGDLDVLVPVFDRSRELSVAAARVVSKDDRFVLAEGNYLLLDQEPWNGLEGMFDYSVMLSPPVEVLEDRLLRRWHDLGLDEQAARQKVFANDLPNGTLVRTSSRAADQNLG